MGPLATAECYLRIVSAFQKKGCWRDADFPKIVIESLPFPDIFTGTPSTREAHAAMSHGLQSLKAACADFAIIPCISVHTFLDLVDPPILPVIDVREIVAAELARKEYKDTLLLSTNHTLMHGVFSECGLRVPHLQDEVQQVITGVLKGVNRVALSKQLTAIIMRHTAIDSVLLGCTELSCLDVSGEYAVIDSLDLLVQEAVVRVSR